MMALATIEAYLREYLSRVLGIPLLTSLANAPAGSAIVGILEFVERIDGMALGGVRAAYELSLVVSDQVPDSRRRSVLGILMHQILSTEVGILRELFPLWDYRVSVMEYNDEVARLRLEVEWDGTTYQA